MKRITADILIDTVQAARVAEAIRAALPLRGEAVKSRRSKPAPPSAPATTPAKTSKGHANAVWTKRELDILRERYPRLARKRTRARELAALMRLLPGRTKEAIEQRAAILGLTAKRAWTRREDTILIQLWPDTGPRTIARHLRGRSWVAIVTRATRLGLGKRWQGYVSLREAARIAGVDINSITKILTWGGVQIVKRGGTYSGAQRVRYPQRVVCPDEVRKCIARWVRSETPVDAANRYGVSHHTMRVWLREAGLVPAAVEGRRPKSRFDRLAIDKALKRLSVTPRRVRRRVLAVVAGVNRAA